MKINLRNMNDDFDILKSKARGFLVSSSSGNIDEAYDLYVAEDFLHHNVYYKGDRDSLRTGMKENTVLFPDMEFEIKMMIREENIVVTHSFARMKPGDPGYAIVHIFRFENEKIVELWDLGQPIPEGTINENGPF